MARVLIAGCGYVGTAAADLFSAAGWEVEGWTHSAESAAQLADKPYPVRAINISSPEEITRGPDAFDVVIQCASSKGGSSEDYRRLYLEGARNLIELLRARRFVFTSSTSVYAQTGGEWVDEESPAEPTQESGRILREAEEVVRQHGGVVVRVAGIYGPGRSALLRKFLSGEARIEGEGERFLNQVHRDDVARAVFLLAALPEDNFQPAAIFNVADNQPMTQRSCYQWLAEALDKPIPPTTASPAMRKRGTSNKRVSNVRLRGLGWTPEFPDFIAGMRHSVLPAANR